jgi:hypothetical protein
MRNVKAWIFAAVALAAGAFASAQELGSDLKPFLEQARAGAALSTAPASETNGGLLPDLRAVLPIELTACKKGKRELLWFSAGVANTGEGFFQMEGGKPYKGAVADRSIENPYEAAQEIFDKNGKQVRKQVIGVLGYHRVHNHWHFDKMENYSLHAGSPDGPVASQARKTSFCLDDSFQLDFGAAIANSVHYTDQCHFPQGVSPGWVDEYGYWIDGQDLDITDVKEGTYYLVVSVNPEKSIIEADFSNNQAWTALTIKRPARGKASVEATGEHSPCASPRLCGEQYKHRVMWDQAKRLDWLRKNKKCD